MLKIAYDGTYMLKGSSGIPSDARSTLKALDALKPEKLAVFLFDYEIPSKKKIQKNVIYSKLSKPEIIKRIIIRIIFLLPFSKKLFNLTLRILYRIKRFKTVFQQSIKSCKSIEIPDNLLSLLVNTKNINFFSTNRSTLERFLPVKLLGKSLKLDTSSYDFFIQQQIDPIQISNSTIHIVRLHDILPITHPHLFTRKGIEAFRTGLNQLLKNNEIIWVMDTIASARQFKELYGHSRKVEVIPCIVGDKYEISNITKKESIFLMVNTIEPRKNIFEVVDAFNHLLSIKELDDNFRLVIAGRPGWKSENLVENLRENRFGEKIIYIEAPTDEEVAALYKKAKFIISASEAEGFGLPPLEGILFGCIPIVSDIPQHRENIGENAIYFQNEKLSIANAMMQGVNLQKLEAATWISLNKDQIQKKFSLNSITQSWNELLFKSNEMF